MAPICGDALLQAMTVLLKELIILLRVGLGFFIEPFQDALG